MITVLTPTYNRAYILTNAYQSLCRQTCKDFEWIIVDDGSTDDTENLVKSWIDKGSAFNIQYVKQENGGKCRAINKGVAVASGNYVTILDSDDFLTDNAIEKITDWIETISDLNGFAGVAGLRGWINKTGYIGGAGNLPGSGYIDAKNTDRRKLHLDGDKAEVYKTSVLKEFPFPEFEGENFLSEHVVWDAIANAGYKLRWFNEIIYKCEYLDDGLTNKSKGYELLINNFSGFTLSTIFYIRNESFIRKYLSIGRYAHVAKLKGVKTKEIKKNLTVNSFQILIGKFLFALNEDRKKLKGIKK